MKKLIVIFIVSFLSFDAFAGDYDQRRNEALNTLESLKLDAYWRDPIRDKLNRYFDYRERVLFESFPIIQNDSTSYQDQASKWKEHFSKASGEAAKQVYDILKDGMPRSALLFLTTMANHESIFFGKLGGMNSGVIRDRIMVYQETFEKERKSLADKWREVDSNDNSIDSMARSAQADLKDLYSRTARSVAEGSSSAESWIRTLLSVSTTLPSTPEVVGVIRDLMEVLDAMQTRTESLTDKIKDSYSKEERIILVFTSTRRDVEQFLSKMNLSLLDREVSEALVQIEQQGRSAQTPGQISDAAVFYGRLRDILKGHYEHFEDSFEKFVSEFDHIFFNALGDKTIESLLELENWRDFSEGVRGIALESALKRLMERASNNFGINVSNVKDPAQRELVEKWVRKNMEALRAKAGQVESFSVSDRVKLTLYMALPSSLRSRLMELLKR